MTPPNKKHYVITGVVKREDMLRLGDEEIIRGFTEGAQHQWTFLHKEEHLSNFDLGKVGYVFERWEDA